MKLDISLQDMKKIYVTKKFNFSYAFAHGKPMIFSLFVPFFAYMSHLLSSSSATPCGLFLHTTYNNYYQTWSDDEDDDEGTNMMLGTKLERMVPKSTNSKILHLINLLERISCKSIFCALQILCLCFIDQNPGHDGHDQTRDIIFFYNHYCAQIISMSSKS